MCYPLKFREHVFKIKKEEKLTYAKTAERFKIGTATLMRWAKRIKPYETRKRKIYRIKREELIEDIKKYPDGYQRERAKRLGASKHGIYYALGSLGVTYKKNPFLIRRQTLLPEKLLNKG